MNKTCYMMIGVPGSGKSTATQELLKSQPHLVSVSSDAFIEAYAKENNKTYQQVYFELENKPEKWLKEQIRTLIKEEKSFIWDQTNVYLAPRQKKINMLLKNQYHVVAIAVELSETELHKRLEKRVQAGGKKVSLKIVQKMLDNYVRPSYEEGYSEIYLIQDNNQSFLLPKTEIIDKKIKHKK